MTTINTSNIEEAKRAIKKSGKPITILAQDNDFNRKILEYGRFDILLGIEKGRKDSFKQIDSGLNDFLANLASKNNISIGIDLDYLRNLDIKEKAIILARIKQNISICKKAKAKIKLLNYDNKENALSFLLSLGSSTEQAKDALE